MRISDDVTTFCRPLPQAGESPLAAPAAPAALQTGAAKPPRSPLLGRTLSREGKKSKAPPPPAEREAEPATATASAEPSDPAVAAVAVGAVGAERGGGPGGLHVPSPRSKRRAHNHGFKGSPTKPPRDSGEPKEEA